ncbi:MAG TPA: hypothetical protein VL993_19710 [Stellaceae bacterium]|nr:hypothetical protein [Stellaceae bacterium]
MRICLYAYTTSAYFFRALVDACKEAGDDVEWSVIFPQGNFRHLFRGALPAERMLYLYRDFDTRFAACGKDCVERALGSVEDLIAALMKDKDGYRHLDKEEQLRHAATMAEIYAEFLDRVRPDVILFPDLEVVDGFVLMNLCRARGIGILYFVEMRLLGRSFFATDSYETLPPHFGAYDDSDREPARTAIGHFRARERFEAGARYPAAAPPRPSLFRRVVVSAWIKRRYERRHRSDITFRVRITRNFMGLAGKLRRKRFELTAKRYFDPVEAVPANYLFYALHYTPESSVNGLEPYYVDQLRAIDALLLNMPPGYRLVVKEHPAMLGLRPHAFYRALRHRPGLVLLSPSVDSRMLMEGAAIVATVTGTVALEAWLLGRPCLMFGRSFFAHLCRRVPALHDLGNALTELLSAHPAMSETEKEQEIAKFINIGADFVIGDPWASPGMMAAQNIAAARTYLWHHLSRLKAVT